MRIMKTKRIICIVLAVIMIVLASACDGGANNSSNSGGGGGGNSGGGGNTDTTTPPGPGGDTGNGNANSGGGDTDTGGGNAGGGNSGGDTGGGSAGGGGSTTNLTGSAAEILGKLVDDTTEIITSVGGFMYMSFTTDVVPDLSQNTVGLPEADFENLVIAASSSMAGIGTQAHQIVLIETKDNNAALEAKKIIAGRVGNKDGYDAQKWICVWPERAIVVESGSFVLLIASRVDIIEAALELFKEMAGNVGEVDVFYEHMG